MIVNSTCTEVCYTSCVGLCILGLHLGLRSIFVYTANIGQSTWMTNVCGCMAFIAITYKLLCASTKTFDKNRIYKPSKN